MVKIISFSLLLIIFQSCKHDKEKYSYNYFIKNGYNLIVSGSGVPIEFNLKQGTIKINFNDNQWNKPCAIKLSEYEKNYLANLLFQRGLLAPKGESHFTGKNLTSPSNEDIIVIYKNGKIISRYYVNRNFESEDFFPSYEERNMVEVRDLIVSFLLKKNEYILLNKKRQKLFNSGKVILM